MKLIKVFIRLDLLTERAAHEDPFDAKRRRIVEDEPKGGINAPTLKGTKTTFTRL